MVCTWNKEICRSQKQSASWLGLFDPYQTQSQGEKNPLSSVKNTLFFGGLKQTTCHVVMSDVEVVGRFCWLSTERGPAVSSCFQSLCHAVAHPFILVLHIVPRIPTRLPYLMFRLGSDPHDHLDRWSLIMHYLLEISIGTYGSFL